LRSNGPIFTDLLWVIFVPPIGTFAWLLFSRGWPGVLGTTDTETVRGWTRSGFWIVLSALYAVGFAFLIYKYFFMILP
jgi:hypothetical protein